MSLGIEDSTAGSKENVATGLVLTGKLETRGIRFAEDRKLVGFPCSAMVATGVYRHPGCILLLRGAAGISSSMDKILERKPLSADVFSNRPADEFWYHTRRRFRTWFTGRLDRYIGNHPLS
jgi:hypothetical protein